MKKKQIEKVPYIGLKKVSRKKEVKYIATTAVKIVAHEKHLFLEVYRNEKQSLEIPVARVVLTKKDFGTYLPEEREWTRQQIGTMHFADELLWEEAEDRRGAVRTEERNLLNSPEDLERIKKFTKEKVWDEGQWWDFIKRKQDDIVTSAGRRAESRRYERRQKALKDRQDNTPELPEDSILKKMDDAFFHRKHYLYYKKRGCWADIACSKCGNVIDARWKSGMSYESKFQRWTSEPREGEVGTCPICGARGEWKCQGKVKGTHAKSTYVFLGQKYKEKGFVMRFVEVEKRWQLEETFGNKGPEMFRASEKLTVIEIARAYFEEGRNVQIDYHKHNQYLGKDFWDDCNLYGMSGIQIRDGRVMAQTYEEMRGTMFQYSGLKEYMAVVEKGNPIDYLEGYQRTPQIEMLVKMNLIGVVENLVRYRYGIVKDENANRPDRFLGIRSDKVKLLTKKKGDIRTLEVLQMENSLEMNWTKEIVEKLIEAGIRRGQLETALKFTTIGKLLNTIEKYAECEFGTGCSSAVERLRHTATIYIDYLAMRAQRGYDMTNTVYLKPRNIEVAHNKMVAEMDKEKQDERIRDANKRFPLIKKNYRALRKKYFYEDEVFTIRPARSAGEIVMEGRILHHCVGGDSYLKKHNEQETVILFLRFKDEQSTPYITIEIKDERIIQWYGAHDKKPDKEKMQRWLDAYTTRLKCLRLGVIESGEEDAMQKLMAYGA